MNPKICFVAAPLIARSGVYNSTIELVEAARARGMDWSAVIGVSHRAAGTPSATDGIHEYVVEPAGPAGVWSLARRLRQNLLTAQADLLISMVPQSDMALALLDRPWVAYLRGLPWPARGESSTAKKVLWASLERLALRRPLEVWATTPTLAREAGAVVDRLVAPGIRPPRDLPTDAAQNKVVWAARYSVDKNPFLFIDALSRTDARGAMYGTGPLEQELRERAPDNVEIAGWRQQSDIWTGALAYVGTSSREAFGRSAVEAAMLGIPVVLSTEFGCAEMLYTNDRLRNRFVLPISDPRAWSDAIQALVSDGGLRQHVGKHVSSNAQRLTIDAAVTNVRAASLAATSGVGDGEGPSRASTGEQ